MKSYKRPETLSIANWRLAPFNRWSFQHVREVIPTALIRAAPRRSSYDDIISTTDTDPLMTLTSGITISLDQFLTHTQTNALTLLRRGKTILNWVSPECDVREPHLLFSVSKSITGLLAGILTGQGKLSPDDEVITYLPELEGSAYGEECTVRHLLDMTVSLDFEEDYLDPESAFGHYRRAMLWNPVDRTKESLNLLSFVKTLPRLARPHGEIFFYASPTSDVLGMVLERAAGQSFATLASDLLWSKINTQSDAYVTVDGAGNARTAGGICATVDDLARIGEMVRNQGQVAGHQIVPQKWIDDMWSGGSREAWLKGGIHLLTDGQYRSQWYQVGNKNRCLCAIGIHGQWIYIDPVEEVVIAKTSAQSLPVDDNLDRDCLEVFQRLTKIASQCH